MDSSQGLVFDKDLPKELGELPGGMWADLTQELNPRTKPGISVVVQLSSPTRRLSFTAQAHATWSSRGGLDQVSEPTAVVGMPEDFWLHTKDLHVLSQGLTEELSATGNGQ